MAKRHRDGVTGDDNRQRRARCRGGHVLHGDVVTALVAPGQRGVDHGVVGLQADGAHRLAAVPVGLVGQLDDLGQLGELRGQGLDALGGLGRVEVAVDEARGVVLAVRPQLLAQPLLDLAGLDVTGGAGERHRLGDLGDGDRAVDAVVLVLARVDEAAQRDRGAAVGGGDHGGGRGAGGGADLEVEEQLALVVQPLRAQHGQLVGLQRLGRGDPGRDLLPLGPQRGEVVLRHDRRQDVEAHGVELGLLAPGRHHLHAHGAVGRDLGLLDDLVPGADQAGDGELAAGLHDDDLGLEVGLVELDGVDVGGRVAGLDVLGPARGGEQRDRQRGGERGGGGGPGEGAG